LRVPPTFVRSAVAVSSADTPTLYHAAQWNTPSTPVIGVRMLSLSVMSPFTKVMPAPPAFESASAFAGSRTSAVT
jgi:hypothetical protein